MKIYSNLYQFITINVIQMQTNMYKVPSEGIARPSPARPGPARPGPAQPGPAQPGPFPMNSNLICLKNKFIAV